MKLLIQKLGSLVTIGGLFFLGITAIHEWCHVVATRIMGGDAYVSYSPGYVATGGFTNFYPDMIPTHGMWWVYFAGGFGVFLGCMLFWFWAWKSKTMWDMYIELPALIIAIWQLSYAFFEACIYPTNQALFYNICGVSVLIGIFGGIGIEYRRLWKWLTTKEIITRKEVYI